MDNVGEQAQEFSRLWMDFASRMALSGLAFKPGSPPPTAAREVRSALLGAMSESAEQYMRSESFLQSMKQSMEAAVTFRKQLNDFLVHMRHEAQAPANEDIDAVLLAVQRLESRLLERLDRLAARTEHVARRLDALEGDGAKEGAKPAGTEPGKGNGRTRKGSK